MTHTLESVLKKKRFMTHKDGTLGLPLCMLGHRITWKGRWYLVKWINSGNSGRGYIILGKDFSHRYVDIYQDPDGTLRMKVGKRLKTTPKPAKVPKIC